ncbi:MAG: hypothetical protein OEV01_17725 [Nitrospira sp.]|nr:hypothetical protein [Nitrospira sp.]
MVFAAIIVRVQAVLEQVGTDCSMEEVVHLCPELTWNQVFLAIDYLSREGQVCVTLDGDRTYRVQAHHTVPVAASSSSPAPL